MKKLLVTTLCLVSFGAVAALPVLRGFDIVQDDKICYYSDGSTIYLKLNQMCPSVRY